MPTILCNTGTTGQTLNLNTTKFLPDMTQVDFLSNLINMFNLYMTIDVNNKTINFETYDTMFMNKVSPYDITDKVMSDTISIEKLVNSDSSIEFKASDNMKVLGDNQYIATTATTYSELELKPSTDLVNSKVFNYNGAATNKISLGFGVPAIKRMYIRNEKDYAGSDFAAGDHLIYLPNISKQNPQDNDNKNFNKNDADTNVFNTEDTIQHKGSPSLYYYYGISNSQLEQKPTVGYDKDYYYVNIKLVPTKIPVVSPFLYMDYRDNINYKLSNPTDDVDSALASYVQTPYLMLGNDNTKATDFSLIFNESSDYGETLFSKFHANKYNRYNNSELLKCNMLMNNLDWTELKSNKPIKFMDQIYSLVSITNYDVVNKIAELVLIKQL